MNKNRVAGIACAAACCMAVTASAGVVGWWRFNGEGANVPNVAETGGVPDGTPRMTDGTIVSIDTYGANPVYGSTTAQMPAATNLFQQIAPRIVDQKTGTVYAGGQSLHWEDSQKNGGVIIPFNEAFVMSNCTIEVIMRIPPEAASRSDRMFPLVQFGRDSIEGWFFAVYRGDNVAKGGVPYVRGNFVDTSNANQTNKGSTTNEKSYVKDLPSLFDGRWHHMALTLHYNANKSITVAYFIDGVCCGGMTYNNWKAWKLGGNCPLAIGCQPYAASTRTFWGDIAEVRISDTTLSGNNFLVPLADGPADDDTALMLTFDSAARGLGFSRQYVVPCQQTAGTGSTNYMWNARNWNIHNAAYNNPFIPRWAVFADMGNADHLIEDLRPTLSTDDTWGDTLGFDEKLFPNIGSLAITGTQPAGAAAPGTDVINVPYPACRLPETNFTLECVFKTEATSTSEMDTFICCPFLKWGVSNGKVLARGYGTSYSDFKDLASSWTVNDGQWHHAAVVYENGYFSSFVDYKRVNRIAKTLHIATGTSETFLIGAQKLNFASGASGAQAFQGKIDAVRITRRALTPGEFLSTRSAEKLMMVTFDDDKHPYAPGQTGAIAPDEGEAGALSGGELPQIAQSRGGWYVMDGENGTNKVECGNAVQFAGSTLYWKNATLLERKAVTVEFFAKFTNLSNGVNLVRCVKSDAAGGTLVWCLWKSTSNSGAVKMQFSCIPVKSDGTLDSQRAGDIVSSGFDGGDGVWHHWAITVDSTDGEQIVAKVYRDYEQFGNTATVNGTLDVPPLNGNRLGFSLGGTGNAGAYIYGTIDQVRVSAGILPVDKFMRYDKVKGSVLFVR